MLILELENGKTAAVALAPGVAIEAIANGRRWLDVANPPTEPVDQWVIDWDAGTVAVGPAPIPPPNYGGAWLALITSPLYARALELAQSNANTPISTEIAILAAAFQAYTLLPPATWASALSASCQRLAGLINATPTPLTQAEQQWVEDWNNAHHLGLTIDWEAP